MKKTLNKVLIFLLIILICLIIFIVYFVSNSKNNIYGRWNFEYSELSKDGKVTSNIESLNEKYLPYIEIEKDKINVCYYENEYICQKVNYKLSGKKLFVEQNDTFLSGNYNIELHKKELFIMTENDGSNIIITSKYKKSNK